MHVMHMIDSLAPGGAERMLVDIANATVAADQPVSVCVTRKRTDLADQLRPEIDLMVLGRRRRFELRPLRRFADRARRAGVDLLHAHGRSTAALAVALQLLGWLRCSILLHDHYGIELDATVPLWFKHLGCRRIAHYVGVCSRLAAWAETAGVPRERISVIENALDLERLLRAEPIDLRRLLAIDDDRRIGLVVGGLREEKGIDLLIEAFSRCRRGLATLLIVGGPRQVGYEERCRQQVAALGLGDEVLFLGERKDVAGLIKGADFAVVPSRSESGPLVLIEFLTAGLPFVATGVGAVAQRIAALGVPDIIPAGSVEAMRSALEELLGLSRKRLRERGSCGLALARRHFDVKDTASRWRDLYRRVLEKPNR